MPITMKGAPMSAWSHEPLPRFNKFSADGGGGSSWPVWDGTLGTFCPSQATVNRRFADELRDLGRYGVSSKATISHPRWQTAIEKQMSMRRIPKRMRKSVAGDDLGPAFML
jgi:hypothetical protein